MSKIVQDGVMYLKNILLKSLPENFKVDSSLDCTDCDLTYLPDGLEVKGDLILGNAYIDELPARLVIGGNLVMMERILAVPSDAIIGGVIVTSFGVSPPALPEGHHIHTDDGNIIIYNQIKILTQEEIVANDFYYPELKFFKNLYPDSTMHAVQYTENDKTYTFTCSGIKDAKLKVDWNRAKLNGIYNYDNYNINEPRTVLELKKIYQVCTGACETGVQRFLKEFNIDMEKLYTIRELRRMVMRLPFPGGSSKMVFLEYFNPQYFDDNGNRLQKKEEAN